MGFANLCEVWAGFSGDAQGARRGLACPSRMQARVNPSFKPTSGKPQRVVWAAIYLLIVCWCIVLLCGNANLDVSEAGAKF